MYAIAEKIETERVIHVSDTTKWHKESLGQYFTPYPVAKFMASLFPKTNTAIKLLDPGAGIGTLSCAFLERIHREKWNTSHIHITAYDIDASVQSNLQENIESESSLLENCDFEVFNTNFLEKTSFEYVWNINQNYTHVIMNPPYKKILTNSLERQAARCFGFETVNLYSAFLGASIALTESNGYIVAIIPRSFCNGVYYKPFREFILKNCAIKHIHLFESRSDAFKDESVLQENIIIMLQKRVAQKDVVVTYSRNATFKNIETNIVPFSEIVNEVDKEKYFSIPINGCSANMPQNNFTNLQSLGIQVSTGPIVDFRIKNFLHNDYIKGLIQLIYPVHLRDNRLDWPKKTKKANAVASNTDLVKNLFPKGFYVLVKRFSTKEETKRIVASLITPDDFINSAMAFENHLNIFHINKSGLPENIAFGLIVWLNTSFIDEKFRLFSGHTQVNATDLRNLPYPEYVKIEKMGEMLKLEKEWSQKTFDSIAEAFIK